MLQDKSLIKKTVLGYLLIINFTKKNNVEKQ